MKALKIASSSFAVWSLGLIWPGFFPTLVLLLLSGLALTLALASISLWHNRFHLDADSSSVEPDHPTRPVPRVLVQ